MPRSELIFWVDRCLGSRVVPEKLRSAWIPEVTERGWIILTKDKAISRARFELEALRRARARYVSLATQQMTGDEQAECRSAVLWHDGKAWRAVKHKK